MADLPDIGGILGGIPGSFANLATSNSAAGWIGIGINIILSTIIGGIVIIVLMEALGKAWGESVSVGKAFLFMLVINVINQFGMALIYSFIPFSFPFMGYIIPLVIWIALMKAFFGELSMAHAAIAGIIGFALSMIVIPPLTGMVSGYLPLLKVGA